jgi:hypothetical protein
LADADGVRYESTPGNGDQPKGSRTRWKSLMALGSRSVAPVPLAIGVRRYTPDPLDRQLRYALFLVLAVVVTLIFLFPPFFRFVIVPPGFGRARLPSAACPGNRGFADA